jgi:hypothetical protein
MASVENICRAIDYLDMESLWKLALVDPIGVLRKLSIRQIGKKRLSSLLAHIKGMEHKSLESNKSFFLLVETLCLEELGSGMFTKESLKKNEVSKSSKQNGS